MWRPLLCIHGILRLWNAHADWVDCNENLAVVRPKCHNAAEDPEQELGIHDRQDICFAVLLLVGWYRHFARQPALSAGETIRLDGVCGKGQYSLEAQYCEHHETLIRKPHAALRTFLLGSSTLSCDTRITDLAATVLGWQESVPVF